MGLYVAPAGIVHALFGNRLAMCSEIHISSCPKAHQPNPGSRPAVSHPAATSTSLAPPATAGLSALTLVRQCLATPLATRKPSSTDHRGTRLHNAPNTNAKMSFNQTASDFSRFCPLPVASPGPASSWWRRTSAPGGATESSA